MILFNYIFYLVLFLGFFLPTNSSFYVPVGPVLFSVRELAFLALPIINYLSKPTGETVRAKGNLRLSILFFLIVVLFTEMGLKLMVYSQPLLDGFKSMRIGFPLFSSLLLYYQGLRPNIRIVWRTLLWAIVASVVLSLLSVIVWLPIYYNIETGEDVLQATKGRVFNANSAFGIIGLYLLFRNRDKWYNKGKLVRGAMILSVVALIISFNRTYLILLLLEFLFLSWSDFSRGKFVRVISIMLLSAIMIIVAYAKIPVVQRQVDKRILDVIYQRTSVVESAITNNRDVIYTSVSQRFAEGHWLFGLPHEKAIFSMTKNESLYRASKTDISLVNIILRYGFLSLLVFLIFLFLFNTRFKQFRLITLLFVAASLNVDSLLNHNSIYFLVILAIVASLSERPITYGK